LDRRGWRCAAALAGAETIAPVTIAGYHAISWRDGGATYVAASDLPEADLTAFQRAFVAGLQSL
jgi:hypothetical protein